MTDYKKDFPLLAGSDIAYLDNAATAQRPEAVLKAVEDFYTKKNANPLRGLYELGIEATEAYEAARERVREFINAGKTSEVVFTRNSTESLNLIAYSYGLTSLKAGDEIDVSDGDMWESCRGRWYPDRQARSSFIWNVSRMVPTGMRIWKPW